MHLQKTSEVFFSLKFFWDPGWFPLLHIWYLYDTARWISALNALLHVLNSIHSKQDNAFNAILDKTALPVDLTLGS